MPQRLPNLRAAIVVVVALVAACATTAPPSLTGAPSVGPARTAAIVSPPLASFDLRTHEWVSVVADVFRGDPSAPIFRSTPTILAVVDRHPGAVLLGAIGDDAATWSTPDLLSWRRQDLAEGAGNAKPWAAAASPSVGVIVGNGEGRGGSAIWRSEGDGEWIMVGTSIEQFPLGSKVRSIVWSGDVFVAVGAVLSGAVERVDQAVPAVWTSPDGLRWDRAPLTLDTPNAWFTTVSVGPGGLVAAGEAMTGPSITGLIASSSDGIRWTPRDVPASEPPRDQRVGHVTASTSLWIASVSEQLPSCRDSDCVGQPTYFITSIDGQHWEPISAGPADLVSIGAAGDELVGLHSDETGYSLFGSSDAVSWSPLGPVWNPPPESSVTAFGLAASTVVAAGHTGRDVQVWVNRLAD